MADRRGRGALIRLGRVVADAETMVTALRAIEQGYEYRGTDRHELTAEDMRSWARRALESVASSGEHDTPADGQKGRPT